MAKISKNARTDRATVVGSKDFVKVIKAVKGKTNNYSFLEKIVHKDKVKDYLAGKEV